MKHVVWNPCYHGISTRKQTIHSLCFVPTPSLLPMARLHSASPRGLSAPVAGIPRPVAWCSKIAACTRPLQTTASVLARSPLQKNHPAKMPLAIVTRFRPFELSHNVTRCTPIGSSTQRDGSWLGATVPNIQYILFKCAVRCSTSGTWMHRPPPEHKRGTAAAFLEQEPKTLGRYLHHLLSATF